MRALFLDRDGVINVDHGYVFAWERFEFMPGVVSALKEIADLGMALVVVTNQSGLARGLFDENQMRQLHQQMRQALTDQGISILDVYWCPHHPQGSVPALTMRCHCRKPEPGLFLRAASEYGIDLSQSMMVGDQVRDVEAARRAGIPQRYMLTEGAVSFPEGLATLSPNWLDLKGTILKNLTCSD